MTIIRVPHGEVSLQVRVEGAETGGSRPTVLLLHGFPDSGQCWRHQVEPLVDAGFQVVVPDLRGFGESSRPTDPAAYRMQELIGDVLAVLAAVGAQRAHVVGHDWGAALAWQVAKYVPDQVQSLTVLSVGHPGTSPLAGLDQRRLSWYMLWFLFPGVAEEVLAANDWAYFREWGWRGASPGADADCDRQVRDLSRPGALTAGLNWYRANIRPEGYVRPASAAASPVPDIACPTLGIWSTGDEFLGRTQMAESGAFVSGGWRYEELDGDHWLPEHAPDEVTALLLDFLG